MGENTMSKLGKIKDVDWMDDIDEITTAYLTALGAVDKEDAQKLEDDLRDEFEKMATAPASASGANIATKAQFTLTKMSECGEPKCVLKFGLFGGLFKSLGSTATSPELQKAITVIEHGMTTYFTSKNVATLPSTILDVLDDGVKKMKMNFIPTEDIKYLDRLV